MTYFYKNTIQTLFIFILFLVFTSEGNSQIIRKLQCDGAEGFENVRMSGSTSTMKDSSEAADEYIGNVVGASTTICEDPDNCSSSLQCNKVATGGNFPTGSENDLGYWEFPKTTVTVKLKCACQSRKKVTIYDGDITGFPIDPFTGEDETGAEDFENRSLNVDPDILIYPNPVQEDLKVDFNNFGIDGNYEIRIFNTVGTLMQTEKVNISDDSKTTYEIRTSDYASGIYYLLVIDESNVITSSKFIVSEE